MDRQPSAVLVSVFAAHDGPSRATVRAQLLRVVVDMGSCGLQSMPIPTLTQRSSSRPPHRLRCILQPSDQRLHRPA